MNEIVDLLLFCFACAVSIPVAHRRIVRRDSGGNTYYYQADQVSSTRVITNSSGTVCYDTDYAPYGQELSHTNTCAQNYKFTGYERDSETGLDYAINRYYNSRIGRFMSPDPAGLASARFDAPQSMNRYAYVENNPISLVDPSGLDDYAGIVSGMYGDSCYDGGAVMNSPNCGAGGSDVTFDIMGNDIFDAIAGAPGTYLTLDSHGNMGFGFSAELWVATLNMIDSIRNPELAQGNKLSSYPMFGFGMLAHDFGGGFTEMQGLIPDYGRTLQQIDYLTHQIVSLGRQEAQYISSGQDVPASLEEQLGDLNNAMDQAQGNLIQIQGDLIQISTGSGFYTDVFKH